MLISHTKTFQSMFFSCLIFKFVDFVLILFGCLLDKIKTMFIQRIDSDLNVVRVNQNKKKRTYQFKAGEEKKNNFQ